jgi:hypothetical protein
MLQQLQGFVPEHIQLLFRMPVTQQQWLLQFLQPAEVLHLPMPVKPTLIVSGIVSEQQV